MQGLLGPSAIASPRRMFRPQSSAYSRHISPRGSRRKICVLILRATRTKNCARSLPAKNSRQLLATLPSQE
jgi:hypothetical protein